MAIKVYKPTTSGRRQMTTSDYSELSKVAPERSLLAPPVSYTHLFSACHSGGNDGMIIR